MFVRKLDGIEIDERDFAKAPLSADELQEIFRDHDPREFLSTRSPTYKALGLAGKSLTRDDAIALMVKDSNLLRRPLVIAGKEIIVGFDRQRLGKVAG